MAAHIETGRRGEEIARNLLHKKGYKILETNWRWGRNEIDIIAQDQQFLVFVEVKTRHSNALMEPAAAVTRDKQQNLIRAANAYIINKNNPLEARFDIVTVLLNKEPAEITHIIDAFYPTLR